MPRRVPITLCCLATLPLAFAHAPSARARRGRPLRVGMALPELPPTWTSSTDGREVVLDAEPDHVPPPIRIHGTRARLTGEACHRELRRRGIQFTRASSKKGLIAFPVRVKGKIGGVYYQGKYSHTGMLADCQLVLTLYRAAAVFRKHGIVRVLWSNTWRPPFWSFSRRKSMPARGRRIGNHPRGLAMDTSVLVDRKGTRYVVQPDWEKQYGGPGNCVGRPKTAKGRLLRQLICDLERNHIFRRILTPDSNWGHRHHFHLTSPTVNEAFVRVRWAGRTLNQPLPGTRTFKRWNRWYQCYRIRNASQRWYCYKKNRKWKPPAPVRYKRPRQKPQVALKLVVPEPDVAPDAGSRAVDPHAQGATAARRRPRPLRARPRPRQPR